MMNLVCNSPGDLNILSGTRVGQLSDLDRPLGECPLVARHGIVMCFSLSFLTFRLFSCLGDPRFAVQWWDPRSPRLELAEGLAAD